MTHQFATNKPLYTVIHPEICSIGNKTLIGISDEMSRSQDTTAQLFGTFMPRREEIQHWAHQKVYDLREYPINYFENYEPSNTFTKWAAMEVIEVENIPEGMEVYRLQGGTYAVFQHKGTLGDPAIFDYIFTDWLPFSGYALDNRPHFDIIGPQSSLDNPVSEEEIWIPIR